MFLYRLTGCVFVPRCTLLTLSALLTILPAVALTSWTWVFFPKANSCSPFQSPQHSVELEGALPTSQEPTAGPYPQPLITFVLDTFIQLKPILDIVLRGFSLSGCPQHSLKVLLLLNPTCLLKYVLNCEQNFSFFNVSFWIIGHLDEL
jgi:hypothetical protein